MHGILGTPNHFVDFIKLVPNDWSIYNILLNGHGKKVEDFAKATMEDWKAQIENELTNILINHKNIVIVAHSMGTLFAVQSQIKHKDKIKKLFLLAPPLNPTLKPSIVFTSIKMLYGFYSDKDLVTSATKNAYGIEVDKNLLKYIKWIPNYISLFKEIQKTNRLLQMLNAETWAFFGKNDELVLISSMKKMQKLLPVETYVLKNSKHFYYDKSDYEFLLNKFAEFCKNENSTSDIL